MPHQTPYYHRANDPFVFATPQSFVEPVKDYPQCASLPFFLSLLILAAILVIP